MHVSLRNASAVRLRAILLAGALALFYATTGAGQEQPKEWEVDFTLYGLAAGMSGDVTTRGIDTDVDVGFDDILENLRFGGMGRLRVGHGKWALTTDLIYMDLKTTKRNVTAEFTQWMVEPSLGYQFCRWFEGLVGVRYNNLDGEVRGPLELNPSGTQEWWDPIVGGRSRIPLTESLSLDLHGDVGGFGAGSDFTWQFEPVFNWRFAKWGSLLAGYRWLYTDYETGSGFDRFRWDILSQGPQIGLTIHF